MENVGLAGADGVLVNSLSVDAELADRGSVAAPVTVVPNGVDLDRFPAATMPPRPGRIAFAGRLVPQKGADVLLRAFGALLRRFPDAELVLAGDGVQRLYLERLARFLGVSRSVSFLGWQSPDELAEHYRSAAVAAVPSLYEPFGLVALEAMATGRPVVVSQVGGLAEILAGDVGGYTVTPGDHLDLATRLGALLADGNLAAAQGRAARRRAEDFGWDGIAERTRAVYDSLSCGPYCGDAVRMALDTAEPEVRDRIRRLIDEAG
jgi:glycogen(starch) synthase